MKRTIRFVLLVILGIGSAAAGLFLHPYWFIGLALALMGALLAAQLPEE